MGDGSERLHVALVLGSSTGGMGRHVRSLVQGLIAGRDRVSVFCPAETARRFDYAGAGARVMALEISASPTPGDLGAVRELRQALRDGAGAHAALDVLHAHGLRAGLVAAWARPASIPLVVTWHNKVLGGGVRARTMRLGERTVARAADVTLGASEDLVARVRELGGLDVRLGPVAAPALGLPVRGAAEVRSELDAGGRPVVLSVGRLHPQKGYHVLVEAAARWRELSPAPVVAIAGTGPSYRELAAAILTARAPVVLLGHRDDVADLLGAATIAVVTSVWEARQLFAQEALAAGVPLVATEVGGLPGLVGDAAILVPPGDAGALDAAVRALLGDPGLRARFAEAGQARAAQWGSEQDTVALVRSVYAELAGRRSAVQP